MHGRAMLPTMRRFVVLFCMAMNIEAEIRELKRRVGEIEGSFGFLTQQIKAVHKDLLAFQTKTELRLDRLETEVRSLRQDMPGIVGSAMRPAAGRVASHKRSGFPLL
jgi:hypothetical protein